MIISDLNYVEAVTEASEVQGGLRQRVDISQRADARAGNIGRNGLSVGNTAIALNLAIPTVVGTEFLTFGD